MEENHIWRKETQGGKHSWGYQKEFKKGYQGFIQKIAYEGVITAILTLRGAAKNCFL